MTDAQTTTLMAATSDPATEQGGSLRVPRSRGVVSGVLLVLAGLWGALVPFVGPYLHFAYTPRPAQTWHWTAARGWYEVLPGGLAVLGGLLLIVSANRIVTSFGAWVAALAGGWFVVGQQVSYLLTLGSPGQPAAPGDRRYVAEYLAFFTGLGAVIILFAAVAAGRLSVRSVRDVRAAARRDAGATPVQPGFADYADGTPQRSAPTEPVDPVRDRAAYERDAYERALTDRAVADRRAATWAGGDRSSGYGTPGTAASAVTSELPTAGAVGAAAGVGAAGVGAAGVGAAGVGAAAAANDDRSDDRSDHREPVELDYRRPERERDVRADDDTAAMPVVHERSAPDEPTAAMPVPERTGARADDDTAAIPVVREPSTPDEPTAAMPVVPEPSAPDEPTAAMPVVPQAGTEPPLVLEPPAGHPDAQRPTAGSTSLDLEPPAGTGAAAATTPEAPRRGVQQPRRYVGPQHPVSGQEGAPPRDAIRTDESIDQELDHEMDLDERPH